MLCIVNVRGGRGWKERGKRIFKDLPRALERTVCTNKKGCNWASIGLSSLPGSEEGCGKYKVPKQS